ncbi:nuclear transport factor 2 family protein [Terrabacter sp. 2RAF25]|uniref:nuclear transport factor 2 family protein n=1 Tax=Terrabacter sp. 2RAF25 TaxID=3232998 RepID=UPI003F996B39
MTTLTSSTDSRDSTDASSQAAADIQAVRAGFEAVRMGDLAAFAAGFHADATWNHRNPDRLGGVKHGIGEILSFLGASMELTSGTLRPVPELFMPDGGGHVAVLTRITATRPDGRSFDDLQVLYFQLEDGKVVSVDQFVGDPPVVTDFWA